MPEFKSKLVGVEDDSNDLIPYQGVAYGRSDLKFTHLPFVDFFKQRDISPPSQLIQLMDAMPDGTYIAGGFVAWMLMRTPGASSSYGGFGMLPKDIDLFFRDHDAYATATKLLSFGYRKMSYDEKGVPDGVEAFEPKGYEGFDFSSVSMLPTLAAVESFEERDRIVQAINIAFFADGIEQVLDGFDFTVTHFGIDVGKRELVFNPDAPFDYAARRLLNHRMESDESATKRIRKYINKGFAPVGETKKKALALKLIVEP
jgi:hypothetical protein